MPYSALLPHHQFLLLQPPLRVPFYPLYYPRLLLLCLPSYINSDLFFATEFNSNVNHPNYYRICRYLFWRYSAWYSKICRCSQTQILGSYCWSSTNSDNQYRSCKYINTIPSIFFFYNKLNFDKANSHVVIVSFSSVYSFVAALVCKCFGFSYSLFPLSQLTTVFDLETPMQNFVEPNIISGSFTLKLFELYSCHQVIWRKIRPFFRLVYRHTFGRFIVKIALHLLYLASMNTLKRWTYTLIFCHQLLEHDCPYLLLSSILQSQTKIMI